MKTILLDLDGTLLKMDTDQFTKQYFNLLCQRSPELKPSLIIEALSKGLKAMYLNNGINTNEEIFLQVFNETCHTNFTSDMFYDFYLNEFKQTIASCKIDHEAYDLIHYLKSKGYRLILATNPIFPRIATLQRMSFINLKESDFELITTYEDYGYTKPNPKYYETILKEINEVPENCIMIGNDVDEDMITKDMGMTFYLVEDCLLNKSNKPIKADFKGTMQELIKYIKAVL